MLTIFNQVLSAINGIIWHQWVILGLLVVGVVYTLWTRFCQFRSLTHGLAVVTGRYDDHSDPGAISHFQALSAALSATVGVGNIGGTALAIAIGGPGALLWMWVVGLLGMGLKTVEVTLSLMHRQMEERGTVRGGPMWVLEQSTKETTGILKPLAKALACMFCVTLLIATFTGGLFFQAWNASNVTQQFFGVPAFGVGIVLTLVVGLVILGGIKRIGTVASRIVPFMCGVYLVAGIYVLLIQASEIPGLFGLIFSSAFSTTDSQGAFAGGTMGAVFSIGMQQAFFSNEAGQGSSPIVHSAAKTDEPVREGTVAGLEPFIDTIVVCTLTGLVILSSGVWNRDADFQLDRVPTVQTPGDAWVFESSSLPERDDRAWLAGDRVVCMAQVRPTESGASRWIQAPGIVVEADGQLRIDWQPIASVSPPVIRDTGIYESYAGAALTALAFDSVQPGLGRWLVTLATWLFGISTMISWNYYGEQGVLYLFGNRGILPYRLLFCAAILVSCAGIVRSQAELTNLANLGTGVMLWVNMPITLLFASRVMAQYRDYFRRGDSGEFNNENQDR